MFAARDSLVGITPQRHPGPLASHQQELAAGSATKASNAFSTSGMGRKKYHSFPSGRPTLWVAETRQLWPPSSERYRYFWLEVRMLRTAERHVLCSSRLPTGVSSVPREWIAIALTGLCLVGMSACERPASEQDLRGTSPGDSETAKSVHPSVPGRNIPCPREGGLDKAGHPCEPSASSAASKDKP